MANWTGAVQSMGRTVRTTSHRPKRQTTEPEHGPAGPLPQTVRCLDPELLHHQELPRKLFKYCKPGNVSGKGLAICVRASSSETQVIQNHNQGQQVLNRARHSLLAYGAARKPRGILNTQSHPGGKHDCPPTVYNHRTGVMLDPVSA